MDPTPTPPPAPPPAWRRGLGVAGFGVLHFALCRLGDELTVGSSQFSTFWPAAGLFVAALLLAPRRDWAWLSAAVAASDVASGLQANRSTWLLLAYVASDLAEGVGGALLVQRAIGGPPTRLRSVRDVAALVGLAAGLATAAASLVGGVALPLAKPGLGYGFARAWQQLWSGDALGVLVVTPALLAWADRRRRWPHLPQGGWAEAAALAATALGASFLVFGLGGGLHLERSYLLLPVLGWAAFRFGLRGATTTSLAVALLSVLGSSRGAPVAEFGGVALEIDQVQLLLAVSVLAALVLAATLEERSAAAAGLLEMRARIDAFMEHSPAALFMLDAGGRLTEGSRSFEAMMGVPAAGLRGGTAREALPGPEGEAAMREDLRILDTGEAARVDRRIRGRLYDIVKFRVPQAGGPPLVGGVAVDVTDQRRTERALQLTQAALDRSLTAVLFADEGGRVGYANEAAARLTGVAREALLGQPVWALQLSHDEAAWQARWRVLRERGEVVAEGQLAVEGRARVDVEVAITLVRHHGEAFGVVEVRDLSERRRAEGAQRLASVGTLAAGMAHEINNPLTFVTTNLAWALDRLGPLRGDPAADEAARALEDAEEGTRRVARVVRDLKAVSRVEAPERHRVDLRAEIETALKLAQHEVRHRAELTTRLDDVPAVEAAEFQLGQVFLNLLVNAAHAVGEGDADRQRIRVVSRTAPDGWAVVEISDTGAGIPPELRARIFEPFFTTKPLGQGTGLGLSICHGIVTGLGGRIEVESEPGQGSLFRVLLPPAPAVPAAAAPGAARVAPEAARARILVVDDEPLIGSTVRRLLGAHEVVALTDPREALRRLEGGEAFDLVLCDLMMPQLSGMDLFDALAAARPEQARRVVFMTGGAFTEKARTFLERCGRPQLGKPFAPQDLRDAVRGWLAERR